MGPRRLPGSHSTDRSAKEPALYTIVLLTENALTEHDVQRVAQLHEPEQVRVFVLVPVETDRNRLVEALDDVALGHLPSGGDDSPGDAPARAASALQVSVGALSSAHLIAEGDLTAADPVPGVVEKARELDADEVVVITEPHLLEETLRRDWASRIRQDLDRPVLHVVAGTDRVVS